MFLNLADLLDFNEQNFPPVLRSTHLKVTKGEERTTPVLTALYRGHGKSLWILSLPSWPITTRVNPKQSNSRFSAILCQTSIPFRQESQNLATPFSLSSPIKPLLIFQARGIHLESGLTCPSVPHKFKTCLRQQRSWFTTLKEIIGRLSAKKKKKSMLSDENVFLEKYLNLRNN